MTCYPVATAAALVIELVEPTLLSSALDALPLSLPPFGVTKRLSLIVELVPYKRQMAVQLLAVLPETPARTAFDFPPGRSACLKLFHGLPPRGDCRSSC